MNNNEKNMDKISKREGLYVNELTTVPASSGVDLPYNALFENLVMNVSKAASFLKVSEKTIYRLVADGVLPHQRLGGCIRFSRTELVKFLEGG